VATLIPIFEMFSRYIRLMSRSEVLEIVKIFSESEVTNTSPEVTLKLMRARDAFITAIHNKEFANALIEIYLHPPSQMDSPTEES
jgi:hypothetical protein